MWGCSEDWREEWGREQDNSNLAQRTARDQSSQDPLSVEEVDVEL